MAKDTGKTRKIALPKKGAGKTTPAKVAKAAAPTRPSARPSARPSGAAFGVYCSECFSDLVLYPAAEGDHLECPVCGHMCARPDGQTVSQMTAYRGAERKWALISVSLAVLAFVAFVMWFYVRGYQPGGAGTPDPGVLETTILPFAAVALLVFSGVIGAIYEKSRWYFYF